MTADLSRRRGHVTRQLKRGTLIAVQAKAPLSEMLGYAEWLRRTTFGRASVSMDYHSYETFAVNVTPPDDFPPAIGMRA